MRKSFAIGMLIILSACAGGGKTEIPVLDMSKAINQHVEDIFTWNDVADRIEFIPIETRHDALLSDNLGVAHIGKSTYYIVDHNTKTIYLINKEGRIVGSFSKVGKGPGEYITISFVHVNEQESTIQVFDVASSKRIVYDLAGGFINETSLRDKGLGSPRFVSDKYLIMGGQPNGNYKLFVTDNELNIRQHLFPTDITSSEMSKLTVINQVNRSMNKDVPIINFAQEDTVFTITDKGAEPSFILNKGEYRLTDQSQEQFMNINNSFIQSLRLGSMPDYYLISYTLGGKHFEEVWSKKDNKIVSRLNNKGDEWGFKYVFPSGNSVRMQPSSISGDVISSTISAYSTADKIEGVKEDDNPVIMLVHMKK